MPENAPGSVKASGLFIYAENHRDRENLRSPKIALLRWEEETLIQIKHVSKTFSGKYGTVHALDDVSIHVEKGDICGIIGFSGAGKSTLIRLVNGLETADSGKVTVCGKELSTLKKPELRALRRKIGMVFQQFNLLESKTVYHNIALPLILAKTPKVEIDKKVKEVLKIVELEDKKDTYISQLSGGQKQRVGIARALTHRPRNFFSATRLQAPWTRDNGINFKAFKEDQP